MPAEPLSPTVGGNTGSGLTGLQSYTPPTTGYDTSGAPTSASTFKMTDGWYVGIACLFGIVTADTRIGPLSAGILGIALIYQLTLLVQHK
jgi:hypothetical protein